MGTRRVSAVLVSVGLCAFLPTLAQGPPAVKPAPVVTGNGSFVANFQPRQQLLVPGVDPVLLLPFSDRWLLEAEGEFEGDFTRSGGVWDNEHDTRFDYLQLDFLANRYLTMVGGRYLTPFGIFNERLHPPWVKYLQSNPLIYRLAALRNNGGMLRGAAHVAGGLEANYSGYFSALTTGDSLASKRNAGGRVGFFVPGRRLELGASIQRILQGSHLNTWGFDGTWQLERIPLDFHGEYARSRPGSGYWIEAAYWLNSIPYWPALTRKSQVVGRWEQFFAPLPQFRVSTLNGGPLPTVDTNSMTWGWNYYVNDGLRLSFSYGRDFRSVGDRNVWSVGIEWRFVVPTITERPSASAPPGDQAAGGSPPSATKSPAGGQQQAKSKVDPATAYRVNCSRCHVEPRRFPEREMATMMMHMRVRANLTEEETRAVLHYLTQ